MCVCAELGAFSCFSALDICSPVQFVVAEPCIYSRFNVTETHPQGIAGQSVLVSVFLILRKSVVMELGKRINAGLLFQIL